MLRRALLLNTDKEGVCAKADLRTLDNDRGHHSWDEVWGMNDVPVHSDVHLNFTVTISLKFNPWNLNKGKASMRKLCTD